MPYIAWYALALLGFGLVFELIWSGKGFDQVSMETGQFVIAAAVIFGACALVNEIVKQRRGRDS